MTYFFICALLVQGLAHLLVSVVHRKQWLEHIEAKETEWKQERQHLLDRIQAPSYDHLKHHEARIIKAQKEEPKDKTQTLEVV